MNTDFSNTDSLSPIPSTFVANPRRFDGPNAPKPGFLTGTAGDEVTEANVKAPAQLTAADFGLVPGGKKLPGNTDDVEKQSDQAVKDRYDELRKEQLMDPKDKQIRDLKARIAEIEGKTPKK